MSEHHFITGVAGFIGSQLADQLLAEGHQVTGVDDFSLGKPANIEQASTHACFHLVEADISDTGTASQVMRHVVAEKGPVDMVWHLAANSDIAAGVADGSVDFRKTLCTTYATLEASRAVRVRRFAFASTSAVYGERDDLLTEGSGPLLPISSYGAAKLASEALLSAAAESFLEKVWIFRFPNVIGPRSTHGAIHDFAKRLSIDPGTLRVLGNGTQQKPYLHVSELLEAMQYIVAKAAEKRNVFNIGPQSEGTLVSFLAETTVARVAPGAEIVYSGGDRGWVGDVPKFSYSTERLRQLGWQPVLSSDEAAIRAIDEIATELGL
jgi:UDP-glucose 4-epimerase